MITLTKIFRYRIKFGHVGTEDTKYYQVQLILCNNRTDSTLEIPESQRSPKAMTLERIPICYQLQLHLRIARKNLHLGANNPKIQAAHIESVFGVVIGSGAPVTGSSRGPAQSSGLYVVRTCPSSGGMTAPYIHKRNLSRACAQSMQYTTLCLRKKRSDVFR